MVRCTSSGCAFGLEEITPRDDGVMLDYLSFEGKPVQILFVFDAQGKISHMHCTPSPQEFRRQFSA